MYSLWPVRTQHRKESTLTKPRRRISLIVPSVAGMLVAATLTVLSVAQVPAKASPPNYGSLNGWISREQIIARAQSWIGLNPPLVYGGPGWESYREDCSGFVSMALNLSPGGLATNNTYSWS